MADSLFHSKLFIHIYLMPSTQLKWGILHIYKYNAYKNLACPGPTSSFLITRREAFHYAGQLGAWTEMNDIATRLVVLPQGLRVTMTTT